MSTIEDLILISEIQEILIHNKQGLTAPKISVLIVRSLPKTNLILDKMLQTEIIKFFICRDNKKRVPIKKYKLITI